MARARKVMHQEPDGFTESLISITPNSKKEIKDFQSLRCATAASKTFNLTHPRFSIFNKEKKNSRTIIKFRWRAHLYRFKMVNDPDYGYVDSTYSELRDGGKILSSLNKTARIEELSRLIEFPLTTEPALYVEVSRLRNKALDQEPPMEWGLNTDINVVKKKLLASSTPGPDFTTTFPGGTTGKRWKSWWASKHTVSGSEPSSALGLLLNVKAGQASGAHGNGWYSRGGRMINTTTESTHKISGEQNPSGWDNVRLERAGLILFSIEAYLGDKWVGIPQDHDDLTNPLSLPIHLDGAEKQLIEIINDKCIKILDDWLGDSSNSLGDRYPLESWSKNSHDLPKIIEKKASKLVNDYDVIKEELRDFIKYRLFKHWFPWFNDSISGSVW